MKDYQPSSSTAVASMDSLPRVQRIRNIPIERIPSPNNNISNSNNDIPENNMPPKKLNADERFRIHSNQVERKIVPGATFLPKIQHHNPNQHRHQSSTLADHHTNNHRRFDGFRENHHHQHPITTSQSYHQHPQYYNLRTTPFGESLRHRSSNTPGSYNSSYEHHHQHQQPSAAAAGIQLVAQYGVGQDIGHSTASTPSASRPKQPFPGTSSRGGSLPTSHSINLPSYNYRIPMPSTRHHHHPPTSSPSPHQQHRSHHHHPNHHQHIHDSDVPEIEASGFPQDPIIEAERQEPDYHLVESGSDILLSTKDDVPAPAPTSSTSATANVGPKIIPETDILDSSCSSDDDDDVVKNCDIEDGGNTRGMNRKFYLFLQKITVV